jgi:hypothetical protein
VSACHLSLVLREDNGSDLVTKFRVSVTHGSFGSSVKSFAQFSKKRSYSNESLEMSVHRSRSESAKYA